MVFHYRLSDFLQPSQQNMRLTGTPQCGHISRACINFSLISENPVFDVSPGRSERLGGLALRPRTTKTAVKPRTAPRDDTAHDLRIGEERMSLSLGPVGACLAGLAAGVLMTLFEIPWRTIRSVVFRDSS